MSKRTTYCGLVTEELFKPESYFKVGFIIVVT